MQLALPALPSWSRLFTPTARPRMTRWYAARVSAGATREISPPPGAVTVHCREGEAWITHDGDPRDVLLQPQECYVPDKRSRMTVHALRGDCVVEIRVDD